MNHLNFGTNRSASASNQYGLPRNLILDGVDIQFDFVSACSKSTTSIFFKREVLIFPEAISSIEGIVLTFDMQRFN